MNKYVLYDKEDDSVICGKDWKAMLFDTIEQAEEKKMLHTEKAIHFSELPLHHQQEIEWEVKK